MSRMCFRTVRQEHRPTRRESGDEQQHEAALTRLATGHTVAPVRRAMTPMPMSMPMNDSPRASHRPEEDRYLRG